MAAPPSVLIVGRGDTAYADRNAARLHQQLLENGRHAVRLDYDEIDRPLDFPGGQIRVLLFFPFRFWNENCENPADTLLYGTSRQSYESFRKFFILVKKTLDSIYGDRLDYVIDPEKAAVDRDKIQTQAILQANGLPISETIPSREVEAVLAELRSDRGVFIKCRYGAEGKGITLLRTGQWLTNYKIQDGKLGNYGVYDQWPFSDFTGKRDLLGQLLGHEVIVEREVICRDTHRGKKVDVRAYAVAGRVPHFFVRANDPSRITTNYSQGAKVLHHPHSGLPASCLEDVAGLSLRASRALDLAILGVDFMLDREAGPLIIEVQTFCDYPSIDKFNLARYLASCPLF